MGNSSSASLGGATEAKVTQPPPEPDTMGSMFAESNPNYWRLSHNKVLPDNLPGMQKSAYLKNGPRFIREHCEPRMRGRLYSPYGSPMSSACVSRMDKENYGAFFDANSPDSTLYKMSSRFNSRMPSVTASRMASALNSPMQSGMTSRATSRRSSFSRGNYIRRKKRHAPLPPANSFTPRALTPESFSSSNDHVRRKFRRKRQAPGPPLQRTWSEKSIDVPVQIAEIRAEIHNGPPPEPAADYDDNDENTSVKMETPPPEETPAAPEEPHQPEKQMPQEPPPELQVTSPQHKDTEDVTSDDEKTEEHLVESEAPSMSTEQVPSEPEVPNEPKPLETPPPPPPPPPPLPGMGALVITPKRNSEVEDVPQKVKGEPATKGVTMRQLSSQEIFAAELLKVFKAREARMTCGTLHMKRTSKSLVYRASITKTDTFTKKSDVANGDITTPLVVKQEVVYESPHSVDSEAWVPADDLSDDAFDDVDEPVNSSPSKRYTKKEKGSPTNGRIYRKNDSAKPSKKSSKYNSFSKLKNSMRTAFGSIGKGIKNRKKIDEVFDVGVDNDSGEKWEIYPAGDYDEVPDGPIKVDHVEKCAAYAYQASTGELVLLPNYDRILVTVDGRRIREADITKVNKPKWLKRLPDESEKKPVVEMPDPPKVDAEKEREQQTKLEEQFAEVRFLNAKFKGSGQNGMPRTLSHDELLRLVSAKIPPPSPESDTETTHRWSFDDRDSGMLDQYFVDMSTYSLDRNNNSKKSKSKKEKKTNTWGSVSKQGSKLRNEKTVSANPVYSSGGEDDETEEKKTPATFTWRANSHESSSTKDSGYKTERAGSDKTDRSSTTPDVSPASTLEARPSGPTTSTANTLNTVSFQPQSPVVATPQQPMFAQPPQWYPAWPSSMTMTTPMPYAPNTSLFNPMVPTYNPAMYNPYMQPMVNGYMNPGIYSTLPAQTGPASSATTQNMAVSMLDSTGNNVSLSSTLPLPSKSNGVTTPPALLPKPRKELILGPVGFRPVNFNPNIKMSSVTIPPTVTSSESPEVEAGNVTTSNGVGPATCGYISRVGMDDALKSGGDNLVAL